MATQAQQNEEIVREYLDCYNRGDVEALDSVMAEDVRVTGLPGVGEIQGLDAYKQWASGLVAAISDQEFEIQEVVSNDTDVAVVATVTGIHDGELMGVEPTGKEIEIEGNLYFRIEDDKIQRKWSRTDDLGTLQQLGAVPEEL